MERRDGRPRGGKRGDSRREYERRTGTSRPAKGASPARRRALEAVTAVREREAFAQDVMAQTVDRANLTHEDRAFATLLVLGVVSTRGVLVEVVNGCMRSPDDVTEDVRDALLISAYEILFLGKSPHAAVDQGVELVRGIAPKAGGVANAVLRKVVEASKSFPFGDPTKSVAACARLHGFPTWLAEKLLRDLGPQEAVNFMRVSNEPAPVFVAVNAARLGGGGAGDGSEFAVTTERGVVEVLASVKAEPRPVSVNGVPVEGCYQVRDGRVLLDGRVKRLVNNGILLVSDAASQRVASAILPDEMPGSVLEIGAGRATKTILIQSNAQRRWGRQIPHYTTLDNRRFKAKLLVERVRDYGIQVEHALVGDATALDDALPRTARYDLVFVDAPCTGLGTLRRHPEIRWRIRPEVVGESAELGYRMLENAAARVAEGGTLAYATCTVSPEENAGVVARFLKSPAGAHFELLSVDGASALATRLTSQGNDAHFMAKMRRKPRA